MREAFTRDFSVCIINLILGKPRYSKIQVGLITPLYECNFAVLQSKISAVGGKAKFHIKPRSG